MQARFTKDDRLIGVIEYGLTAALIAVVVIAGVQLVGTHLKGP
jgi:Flp pilus assembly pilin Flp